MRQDEVDLVRDQRGGQFLGRSDAHVEANVRVGGLKPRDGGRQQLAGDRLDGGDAGPTAHQAAQLLDLWEPK